MKSTESFINMDMVKSGTYFRKILIMNRMNQSQFKDMSSGKRRILFEHP